MFVKAIKVAKLSIFPIFKWDKISDTQAAVSVTGTGFLVNSKGYLVSTAHIFEGRTRDTKFNFLGQLPDQVQNPPLEIKEIARDDHNDIFIGKIERETPVFFTLSKSIPSEGKSVCISGYPLASITSNNQGGLELGGVRRYFQPTFVLDRFVGTSGTGGITRTHDGFVVRDVGLFGMSGGPVFDVQGTVVGMQASVTQPRPSTHSSGRVITVENAIAIRSSLILEFLKKHKIATNFLGKF